MPTIGRAERRLRLPAARRRRTVVGTADDGILRDPTTDLQFPGNVIPQSRITAERAGDRQHLPVDGRRRASSTRDTPTANNATYQLYNPFESRQDIVRIDLQATDNQRIHGRYLHDEYNLIEPYGTFSGRGAADRARPTARAPAPATRSATPTSSSRT